MWIIKYGNSPFGAEKVAEISLTESRDLVGLSLEIPTMYATIHTSDTSILNASGTVEAWEDGIKRGTWYIRSVDRVGAERYRLSCASALELLASAPHPGGIYSNTTAKAIVDEICGSIPHYIHGGDAVAIRTAATRGGVSIGIPTQLSEAQLSGWIPYADGKKRSARDNLLLVCFAIGASVKTDLDGALRIEPLWSGIVGNIPASETYIGGAVTSDKPVTAVSLTEHLYLPTNDEIVLFDGDATDGDIVEFPQPVQVSTLRKTDTLVLPTVYSANHAVLRGGSGQLIGKVYRHVTNTRKAFVMQSARPNEKSIDSATLVSAANSQPLLDLLCKYYAARQTIKTKSIFSGLHPGNCAMAYDPYDRELKKVCVQSSGIVPSAITKSDQQMLVGFDPHSIPPTTDTLKRKYTATTQGETTPSNAIFARLILVGKGQNGTAGGNGANGGGYGTKTGTGADLHTNRYFGGAGGAKGKGGQGGKILDITVSVTPNASMSVSIGSNTTVTIGNATYSSANGTRRNGGYVDSELGVIGASGVDGVKGGNGGDGGIGTAQYSTYVAGNGYPGDSVAGKSGGAGGAGTNPDTIPQDPYIQSYSGGGGGGAGSNANGADGSDGAAHAYSASSVGGAGGAGKSGANGANYGCGGNGGDGGGGGGGAGELWVKGYTSLSDVTLTSTGGTGGAGGSGGSGRNGCAIVYFYSSVAELAASIDVDNHFEVDKYGRILIV